MRELIKAIEEEADPEAARALSRYFQVRPGGYGEGDVFVGVKLSRLRELVRPYRGLAFEPGAWLPLLHSPVHEHRLACLVIMAERARRGGPEERTEIYRSYLANTAYVNNWDLVDVSCGPIVGGYLWDRDRSPLDALAASDLVWDRRIAMVSTGELLRHGESADTFRLAIALLHDGHDLIRKATGWMLREAGRRVSRSQLADFLERYAAEMPRTTLRNAIEHLPPDERRHFLDLAR